EFRGISPVPQNRPRYDDGRREVGELRGSRRRLAANRGKWSGVCHSRNSRSAKDAQPPGSSGRVRGTDWPASLIRNSTTRRWPRSRRRGIGTRADRPRAPATIPIFSATSSELDLVPKAGLEPARISPHAPQTCASTNSATWASIKELLLLRGRAAG